MIKGFRRGPHGAKEKFNQLISSHNRQERHLGGPLTLVGRQIPGYTTSISANQIQPRIPRLLGTSGTGTPAAIFKVVSNASGDGIYNCYQQQLKEDNWADTTGLNKFINAEESPEAVEVLNLAEFDAESEYVRHLAANDLIAAWQGTDDEGNSRWEGLPLRKGAHGNFVRRAFCKNDAGAAKTITCFLDNSSGTEITVNCDIAQGGTKLNEASPRLIIGDPISVYKTFDGTNDKWYCDTVFQPTEECDCVTGPLGVSGGGTGLSGLSSGSIIAYSSGDSFSAVSSSTGLKALQNNAGTIAWAGTTGTGDFVLSASPTFTGTPVLSTATATTLNGLTLTSQAVGFTIAGGTTSKTLTLLDNAGLDQDVKTTSIVGFAEVDIGQAGSNAATKLAVGLTATPSYAYPGYAEIFTTPASPAAAAIFAGLHVEMSHVTTAWNSLNMAGCFFNTASGDITNSAVSANQIVGLFGGATTALTDTQSSGVLKDAFIYGLNFNVYNNADWTPTGTTATADLQTYGAYAVSYLGYTTKTISGKTDARNYGGYFNALMAGTYNSSTYNGTNVGVYAKTTNSSVTATKAIDSYALYVDACASNGDLTSWNIYAANALNSALNGSVRIGAVTVPTYTLDVTGNIRCSTGFGCNGTTPQTAYSVNAASTDLDTVIALCNQLRAALIANGICVAV